jgi:hypothetical protein
MLAQILVYDGAGTNVPTAPVGWTVIRHDSRFASGHLITSWLYFHVAGGSESASYTWSISSQFAAGMIGAWRGASATPIDLSSGTSGGGTSPVSAAAPSLTPTNNNELQVFFYGAQSNTAPTITEPIAISSRANVMSTNEGFSLADGDKAAPSAGNASPTFTAMGSASSGSLVLTAQAVLLKP